MKDYIDLILKMLNRPINIEVLYNVVENYIQKENINYIMTSKDKDEINKIINKGIETFDYYETSNNEYISILKTPFRKGIFYGNKAGEGFVVVAMSYIDKTGKMIVKEEKYSVFRDNCNNAIDGDYVLINVGGNGKKTKVEKVLNRNLSNIIGEVIKINNDFYVRPIDKRKSKLIIILNEKVNEGDIVSVSLEKSKKNDFYVGKLIRSFKYNDSFHAVQLIEAFKSGMPEGFSKDSLEQLESIPDMVVEKDFQNRLDLTGWNIFSIDGKDTKDKDDCISLEVLSNGNYLLGVHISDVPYYIKKDSPLDKDAFRKGTSYYFGGYVEPQFPKKISNGICSLTDGVNRITKSILIEFDKNGNVISREIVSSVIHSRIGMSYDKVNDILNKNILYEEYLPYVDTLKLMNEFAQILRKKRINNGSINFDRPEIRFKYDEKGYPIDIYARKQNTAEIIIEEFMLVANVNVATILSDENIPCIYRIHDIPNRERLNDFLSSLKIINEDFSYDVDDILNDKRNMILLTNLIKNNNMLNTNLIKCMSHACYDIKNIGHYGTGFDIYCHFTSPIRRLSDLVISRIIDDCYLEKDEKKKQLNTGKWEEEVINYAIQASNLV